MKHAILGSNQSFKVGDHDFSKLSLIPDGILILDIPTERSLDEDIDAGDDDGDNRVTTTLGEWYWGQVYYGIKSMVSDGIYIYSFIFLQSLMPPNLE